MGRLVPLLSSALAPWGRVERFSVRRMHVAGCVLIIAATLLLSRPEEMRPVAAAEEAPSTIAVDYPRTGSIFPPEITPPTFLWHDSAKAANLWRIEVTFADGSPAMHFESPGAPMEVGEID